MSADSTAPDRTAKRTSYCLFQDAWWLNLATGGSWEEVVVAGNDGTTARLPYRVLKRYGMTVLSQPRMTPYAGPWFRPSNAKAANQFSERRGLTVELISKLPRYDLFSQNLWPGIPDWLPFYWAGFLQRTDYTNWLTDISDPQAVWNGFLDAARWEIRKAQKRVHVVVSDDVDRLCRMHRLTFAQQGLNPPQDENFLRRVAEGAIRAGHGRLAFAEDDKGNTHAVNFLIYDDRSAHYVVGGSDKQFRSSGAASLLVWDAIQFASNHSAIFDFEGSMVEGISRFFRSFNPASTPILHIYRMSRRARVGVALYDAAAAVRGLASFRP